MQAEKVTLESGQRDLGIPLVDSWDYVRVGRGPAWMPAKLRFRSVLIPGFSFAEVARARVSVRNSVCCHFSSDGKLLATGGHDKKVVLWCAERLQPRSSLQGHSFLISDVRFSSSMPRLATSSFDKL
uniref:Uncharacterized protein n=1 Tax=Arundo donax TaxID=35708 RepID=A0A0A9DZJ9_ARUDO